MPTGKNRHARAERGERVKRKEKKRKEKKPPPDVSPSVCTHTHTEPFPKPVSSERTVISQSTFLLPFTRSGGRGGRESRGVNEIDERN